MTGGCKRCARALDDGLLQITIAPDDGCIRTAHFERDDATGSIEIRFKNRATHGKRTSEEDSVDAFVRDKCASNRNATLHDIEETAWQSCFNKALRENFCCARRLLAGLENHCISRKKRRDELPIRKMRWKVERTEDRHHTVRTERTNANARCVDGNFVTAHSRE